MAKLSDLAGECQYGLRYTSPTGQGVRQPDQWGDGRFGASRDEGTRRHKGVDYIATPGQAVVYPTNCATLTRISNPYSDDNRFSGAGVSNPRVELYLWYFAPDAALVGKPAHLGQPIGTAQDLNLRYPGITPHIHVQIITLDLTVLAG